MPGAMHSASGFERVEVVTGVEIAGAGYVPLVKALG